MISTLNGIWTWDHPLRMRNPLCYDVAVQRFIFLAKWDSGNCWNTPKVSRCVGNKLNKYESLFLLSTVVLVRETVFVYLKSLLLLHLYKGSYVSGMWLSKRFYCLFYPIHLLSYSSMYHSLRGCLYQCNGWFAWTGPLAYLRPFYVILYFLKLLLMSSWKDLLVKPLIGCVHSGLKSSIFILWINIICTKNSKTWYGKRKIWPPSAFQNLLT